MGRPTGCRPKRSHSFVRVRRHRQALRSAREWQRHDPDLRAHHAGISYTTVITRFNGFPSALFTGTPKAGYSSGEMLDEVDHLVQTQLPSQESASPIPGNSYQQRVSSGDAGIVFALGLVIVFLVPGRSVRELGDSLRGAVRGSSSASPRYAPDPRPAERHLLPDRSHYRRRARGQKRHPHRGVRQ